MTIHGLGLRLLLVLPLAACGPESGSDLDEMYSETALVNGTTDHGHESVGALLTNGGMCTATLVGLRTVLTAAHCIQPGQKHRFVVANSYWQAESAQRHPSYAPPSTDNDLGLVLLKQAPPVKYSSISTTPPTVGQALTLVGYGATSQSGTGSGTKRVGYNKVSYLSGQRIMISGSSGSNANLCFGDSGGPTFAEINGHTVQVGVHSTIAGTCGQQGHDIRVDIFAEWIRATAQGDVSEDGKPSPLDDTSPPQVIITAPTEGASLRGEIEVTAEIRDDREVIAAELLVDGKVQGNRSDPPYSFSVGLESGHHTIRVVGHDPAGNTGHDEVGITILLPARFGEQCDTNDVCASGLCGNYDGRAFCTQTCDPATSACPDRAECLPAGGGLYVCGAPVDPQQPSSGGSGCAVGGGPVPSLSLLLGLLLFLGLRRRSQ